MASRKPDFRLPMPLVTDHLADTDAQRQPGAALRSPRSPRFREDFDAPFSEALLNASRTTLATDASGSYPSSQSRNSLDVECRRHASYASASASASASSATAATSLRRTQAPPPSPLQLRQDSWTSSESNRRSSVNERIREWAKKSFVFSRKASVDQSDDAADRGPDRRQVSQPAAVGPTSDKADSDANKAGRDRQDSR